MNTVPDLADQADLADLAEMVSATAARSLPSTRAGGQDYGSLTNSLKSEIHLDDFLGSPLQNTPKTKSQGTFGTIYKIPPKNTKHR